MTIPYGRLRLGGVFYRVDARRCEVHGFDLWWGEGRLAGANMLVNDKHLREAIASGGLIARVDAMR